jgi:Ca2+-binding RTX toxin-like protein
LIGGRGHDLLRGRAGDDLERGGPGADLIYAGQGADETFGNRGGDVMFAVARADGPAGAVDMLHGGRGDDRIHVNDGASDRFDCGRGRHDKVVVDEGTLDQVTNCELIRVRPPSAKENQQEIGS